MHTNQHANRQSDMLVSNRDRRNEVSQMLKAELSFQNCACLCNFLSEFSATVLLNVDSSGELRLCPFIFETIKQQHAKLLLRVASGEKHLIHFHSSAFLCCPSVSCLKLAITKGS